MYRMIIIDEHHIRTEQTTYDQAKVWNTYTNHIAKGHKVIVYLNGELFLGRN